MNNNYEDIEITDDTIRLLLEKPEEARKLFLTDFCAFVAVFHFYMERQKWIFRDFHREIADKLYEYVAGTNKKQNLYIGVSPRAGKSKLCIYFIAWCYGINPTSNFLYTSYSDELCNKHSKLIRNIVQSELFTKVFRCSLDPSTTSSALWKMTAGGEFRSISLQGSITGFGAGTFKDEFGGAIVIDDFMKADDYRYQTKKNNVVEIFENTLRSRKNRPAKDPTIIIAQRLAQDDLINYIQEHYPDEWEFYVIPALDEETGKSFWEERYPVKMLLQMKEENKFLYYSQYQQAPIAQGGGVIKHEWWRFYKDMKDQAYRRIYITADTAMKTKEWNDFTAIGVWGVTASNRLRLLDLVHGRFEMPELESTMLALWEKWRMGIGTCRCSAIYIEDKASGTQLIQGLMRKGGLPIMRVMPERDKYTRVMNAIPQLASGNIELPESDTHPLSKILINEADLFSADDSHAHDDLVDMWCYAVDAAFNSRGII